jgi:hypothetical protein
MDGRSKKLAEFFERWRAGRVNVKGFFTFVAQNTVRQVSEGQNRLNKRRRWLKD